MRRMILLTVVSLGCTTPTERACRVGADCASGVCLADGTCAAADRDAGADAAPQQGSADAAPGCANHDGTITRAEVTLAAGRSATFRIATDATISTAGTANSDGTRTWDLSGALANDHDSVVETQPPAGAWWASQFPNATYAAQLSDGSDLLGVFEATSDALLLLGVVSPQAGMFQTLLTYDPAVTVLSFPLSVGASWSTSSTATGQTSGVFSVATEAYADDVDASGTIATPYGTFPVLRVRVVLTRTVGVVQTIVRTYLWIAECYGTVAAVVSNDDEPSAEFTTAAEARRLSP
jgi:hypothetical protein